MKIFSGSSNKPLAEKIAHAMNLQLSPLEIFTFPDGEKRVRVEERVVDEHCIVVQSTSTPVAENYMELFFIIDALKRSGASQVIVVMPYVGYQRQDHVFRSGEAVSLDVVVHALERTGAEKVIMFDLHSIKIPEVFSVPVAHLSALPLFAEKIKELGGHLPHVADDARLHQSSFKNTHASLSERRSTEGNSNIAIEDSESAFNSSASGQTSSLNAGSILVSPDMGGLRRIEKMSELLDGMEWVATVKNRDLATGEIVIDKIEGDITKLKKRAFIVDDMISSGKTIVKSAELLKKHGVEHVTVFVTHAIFSQEAPQLLQQSVVDHVYVTDSVAIPENKRFAKLTILSIADMVREELRDVA